jgi:hypothetical protein
MRTSLRTQRRSRSPHIAALIALGATVACASTPRASEVDEHLARARRALGWDRLAERNACVEVLGAARFLGTDAEQRLVFDSTGRVRESIEGELSQHSGFDGATYWIRDWTDTPRALVLGDRTRAELDELFTTGRWTRAGERLSFELVPAEGAEDAIALAFRHADGVQHGTLVLDAATHRPRSVRFGSDGARTELAFHDWRVHDGFAFATRIATNEEGFTRTLTAHSVRMARDVDDARFTPRLEAPADTRFDAQVSPQLDVKRVASGHLLVHPLVDGRDLGWFIFDSGAGTSCISKAVTDGLRGPLGEILATGIGGSVPAHFWRAEELRIGPLSLANPTFMELDLAFLEQHFGVPVGGILGYELFARCVVAVDMSASRVALHDPAKYALPAAGRWTPTQIFGRRPCVTAQFEGRDGVFLIDTGAAQDTVTFHYQVVADLAMLDGRDTTAGAAGGVGGVVATRVGELSSFRLGGRTFENLRASFVLEDRGAFANDYLSGNIGGVLLEPFELVFDYPNGRLGFIELAGSTVPEQIRPANR